MRPIVHEKTRQLYQEEDTLLVKTYSYTMNDNNSNRTLPEITHIKVLFGEKLMIRLWLLPLQIANLIYDLHKINCKA